MSICGSIYEFKWGGEVGVKNEVKLQVYWDLPLISS